MNLTKIVTCKLFKTRLSRGNKYEKNDNTYNSVGNDSVHSLQSFRGRCTT